MEVNLEQLKKNFIVIKDIRNKVTNLFQILGDHLIKLKQTYSEFVKMNKDNLFVFGLDSFQFQSKLIDIEFGDMKRLFLAINNRMYCEYYKLYKIIAEYIKDNINDRKSLDIVKLVNSFPVYKDLEPFKQYNFETIQEIHDNIILLLYGIDEFILNKENELQWHQKKQSIGLNINNFVNTFNYNILIVKEKGTLFISYIEFFHSLHTKHLQRFAMKMNLMYTQLTHDIRFDDNGESTDDKKKELINKYQDDNIDKELLKQIKLSVDDNASNFSHDSSEISYLNSPIHSVQSKSFDFESDNQADTTNNFNCFNSPKQIISSEEIDLNPVKKSMGSIFKKNVKKVVNSLGLFKNTKKTDDKLKLSSENLLNQTISSKMSINLNNTDIEDKISNKSRDSSFKKDSELLTVTNQESDKIEKTKSLDEIFLELSTQCNDLIKSNEKNSSLCSSSEETITSFIEIYDNANNGPVVSELVNNELDETELVNNELDETELVNNESDETESVNIEAEKTESVNIEAEKTELVNNEAEETELVNNEAEETELVVSELVNNEAEETKLINNAPFESEVSVETVVNKKKKKKSKPKKK
jgi:hypothetical protein